MRLAHGFVVLTLLAACHRGELVAYPRDIRDQPTPEQTLLAIERVRAHYAAALPEALNAKLPASLSLTWVRPPLRWNNTDLAGLTFTGCRMYVVRYDHEPMWQTSLAHEMVHCLHEVVTGKMDVEHADKRWWQHLDTARGALVGY